MLPPQLSKEVEDAINSKYNYEYHYLGVDTIVKWSQLESRLKVRALIIINQLRDSVEQGADEQEEKMVRSSFVHHGFVHSGN